MPLFDATAPCPNPAPPSNLLAEEVNAVQVAASVHCPLRSSALIMQATSCPLEVFTDPGILTCNSEEPSMAAQTFLQSLMRTTLPRHVARSSS